MPTIHYAIEVFTASTLTNTDYALVDGVFRFVTDRPGYDSETIIPYYGANEIDPLTGADVGIDPVAVEFFEGFLQKTGITANPTRSIDISTAGSYSTDSSFQFTLRNDMLFWNFLQDPLNTGSYDATNAINLTGCIVVLWASIDDVFYQIARGRVTNNPYTETDYNFNVEDDATTIHKNIPPQISTYLGMLNNTVQRQQGAVIPVVFGNVPYSPLGTNQAVNNILQLNAPYYPAAATNYAVDTSTTPPTYSLTLQTSAYFAPADLVDMYLSVIGGDIGGTAAATGKYYRIVSASVSGSYLVTVVLADPIILFSSPGSDTVLTAAEFNNTSTGGALPGSGIANTHTWWFEITNLSFSANVSQNPVQVEGVYSYNSNLNSYDNDSSALKLSATPESTVDLIADTIESGGGVDMFERINLEMVDFGLSCWYLESNESYSDAISIGQVTDGDRLTWKEFVTPIEPDDSSTTFVFFADYKPQPTNPSGLNQVVAESYSALYFLIDLSLSPQAVPNGTVPFQVVGVKWTTTDITGFIRTGTTTAVISNDKLPVLGNYASPINFLPNSLVKNHGGSDAVSLINAEATDGGLTYKSSFMLTDLSPSIFTRAELTNIRLECDVVLYYQYISPPCNYNGKLYIKEIAIVGERLVNILSGSLFASTTGETIANDGITFANSVYRAFQHIMEDYDGIPPAFIDYGDLPTNRDVGWPVSRTLTDQKISADYLNELCQHSFVAMFSGRTGKRTLRTLSVTGSLTPTTGPGKTSRHDESLIIVGSLGNYAKTDVSSLFNCFYIQYAYDPGSQQYARGFNVNSLLIGPGATFPDHDTLNPDGSGNPYWWAFFSGLQVSATDTTVGYSDALAIWTLCQNAFTLNQCSKPVQGDISELPWFTDSLIYDPSDTSGSGVNSPAYKLLKMLAEWSTVQKETINYCIPLNSATIQTEIMDIVEFVDTLLTNTATRDGWISGMEYDCANDQIKITLTLQPLTLAG